MQFNFSCKVEGFAPIPYCLVACHQLDVCRYSGSRSVTTRGARHAHDVDGPLGRGCRGVVAG